jgi:hypothetical protein
MLHVWMFHRFSHKRTCWKLMFSILCLFKNVNSRCHRHKLDWNWFLFLRDVGFRETASVEWVCNVLTLRQILWFEEENMERKLGGKRIKERESEKRKLGKNICSMYLSLSLSLSLSVSLCLSLSLSVSLCLSLSLCPPVFLSLCLFNFFFHSKMPHKDENTLTQHSHVLITIICA